MKAAIEFTVSNLEATEQAAKELLEHIKAIKKLQRVLSWQTVDADVSVNFLGQKK